MIFIQITEQIKSLSDLLQLLTNQQYTQKIEFLGNASIGSHTRHIIELIKCAADGYHTGTVDYLNRVRDLTIENDKSVAMQELNWITKKVKQPDRQMNLVVECDNNSNAAYVSTSYFREMVYNTEHAIHHLALIRVALREMKLEIAGDHFGMAYSTIKYLATQRHSTLTEMRK